LGPPKRACIATIIASTATGSANIGNTHYGFAAPRFDFCHRRRVGRGQRIDADFGSGIGQI